MKWCKSSWTVGVNLAVLLYAFFYPDLSDGLKNGLIVMAITNLSLRAKTQKRIK
jgi:putative cell wall-binding protein